MRPLAAIRRVYRHDGPQPRAPRVALTLLGIEWGVFVAVAALLVVATLGWTVHVDLGTEHADIGSGNPLVHVSVLAAVAVVVHVLARTMPRPRRRLPRGALSVGVGLATTLCAVGWIGYARSGAVGDQWAVLHLARDLAHGLIAPQDISYLRIYPHQAGLALYEEAVSRLAGDDTVVVLQLLAAGHAGLAAGLLVDLAERLFTRRAAIVTAVLQLGWLPPVFLTTFVYGNTAGHLACIGAAWLLARYLLSPRWQVLVAMAVVLGIGTALRGPTNVMAAAVVVVLLLHALREGRGVPLLGAALVALAVVAVPLASVRVIEERAGLSIGAGLPKGAWIAMGAQEGPRGAGWFNAWTGRAWESSPAHVDDAAVAVLQHRLDTFERNPGYALDFAARKTTSQWADPTFQSLWTSVQAPLQPEPAPTRRLLAGPLGAALVTWCDLLQSLVAVAALAWAVLGFRRRCVLHAVLPLAVVGGFLFQLGWEAKAIYPLTWFTLLLPMAGAAIGRLAPDRHGG